ncbi:MAG TPA: MinD/ParA family protein [Bacillota bacterium]|nr:MinD/ParA family protein [Bacillota bacterium]HPZ64169.1 MinD/ParA family protein [Bacillota bacterium]HQD05343.1 MinD/ParA family protein [Bacillota bacterium]
MFDQAEKLRRISMGSVEPKSREQSDCRVVAVASGKGGVGKTNLVVNMSILLAQWGNQVIILDADLGLANVDVLLRVVPEYTIEDVLNGTKTLEEVILRGPLDIKIIPGGSGLFHLANLDQGRREQLIERLKSLEGEGNYLFIDSSAGISRNVLGFIGAADELIIVTTPEPTALADAYAMLKVVAETGCKSQAGLVVNCVQHLQQGERIYKRLKEVTGAYLDGMELTYLGEVYYDPVVSRAVQEGVPFVLSFPRSLAAASLTKVARRLAYRSLGSEAESRGGVGSFFTRLYQFVTNRRGRIVGS